MSDHIRYVIEKTHKANYDMMTGQPLERVRMHIRNLVGHIDDNLPECSGVHAMAKSLYDLLDDDGDDARSTSADALIQLTEAVHRWVAEQAG